MVKITYAKLYVSTVIKVTFHVKYFILLSLTIKIKKLFGKYQVLNGKGFTVSPLFTPDLKKKRFYPLFSEIVYFLQYHCISWGLHPDVAIADVIHKISNYELSNGVKHENKRQLKTCVMVRQNGKWLLNHDLNTSISK